MNETITNIMKRRSCRIFTAEPVPREALEAIIEAGRYAPSGGNNQTCRFLVFVDADKKRELDDIASRALAAMEITEGMYRPLINYINRAKAGGLSICFNAPVLILVANRKGYGNNVADSACAIENMFIAATSLGVGSCWVNQPHWLENEPEVHEFLTANGLAEDETICGGLVLGMPDHEPPAPQPRKGNEVIWI